MDRLNRRGECSEKGAPDLKVVMRRRERVYMSFKEEVGVGERARDRVEVGAASVPAYQHTNLRRSQVC